MQVAKYWRNKKLRYRLLRDKRTCQQGAASGDIERANGVAAKVYVKRETVGMPK